MSVPVAHPWFHRPVSFFCSHSKNSPDFGGDEDWETIGDEEAGVKKVPVAKETTPLLKGDRQPQQHLRINADSQNGEDVVRFSFSRIHINTLTPLPSSPPQVSSSGFTTPPELASPSRSRSGTQISSISQDSVAFRERERLDKSVFHRLVQKGVHMTWNNQFAAAETELSKLASFCPRHALHLGEVSMVKQAITGKLQEKELTMQNLLRVEKLALEILGDQNQLVSRLQPERRSCLTLCSFS